MTEQYTQTVDVDIPRFVKRYQFCGILFILFSLGFVMVAIFLSWYALIGFALFFAIGAVNLHIYNSAAKEYIYEVSTERLVIAKKDVLNKTKRIANILFKDVNGFSSLEDMYCEDTDILACSDPYSEGVYALSFCIDNKRLLFAPDEYMTELIKQNLSAICPERETEDE